MALAIFEAQSLSIALAGDLKTHELLMTSFGALKDNAGAVQQLLDLIDIDRHTLSHYVELEKRLQNDKAQAERAALEERIRRDEQLSALRVEHEKEAAECKELRAGNTALTAELSGLKSTLVEERKSAAEKLELLENARKQLSDVFKGLSAEALKSNNRAFLELAKTSLELYQRFDDPSKIHADTPQLAKKCEELAKAIKKLLR